MALKKYPHGKSTCRECNWHGTGIEVLHGVSPFDGEHILGCPYCKSIDPFQAACEEEECWEEATCGTPTPAGYWSTCRDHKPESEEQDG